MSEKRSQGLSRESVNLLRIFSICAFLFFVLVVFFGERIFLTGGEELERYRIVSGVLALFFLLAGILGWQFIHFYRSLGKVLLILALGFAVVELASTSLVVAGLNFRESETGSFALNFLGGFDTRYSPFTGWQSREPERLEGNRLAVFGGSEFALPFLADGRSPLACDLDSILSVTGVGIADHSQPYYNTAQSITALILQLRTDVHLHDVLILAGPGDILSAYRTGEPSVPIGTDLFRSLTWGGEDEALMIKDIMERALERNSCRLSVDLLLSGVASGGSHRFDPFASLPQYEPEKLDSLAANTAARFQEYCIMMEALSESFSFQGRIIWLKLNPATDPGQHPLYDLHMRTDPLIQSLADSMTCLSTVEYSPAGLPGEAGSGYTGFLASQAGELALLLSSEN